MHSKPGAALTCAAKLSCKPLTVCTERGSFRTQCIRPDVRGLPLVVTPAIAGQRRSIVPRRCLPLVFTPRPHSSSVIILCRSVTQGMQVENTGIDGSRGARHGGTPGVIVTAIATTPAPPALPARCVETQLRVVGLHLFAAAAAAAPVAAAPVPAALPAALSLQAARPAAAPPAGPAAARRRCFLAGQPPSPGARAPSPLRERGACARRIEVVSEAH